MSENEAQSPFGRSFIAACIVIGAVLLCGAILIISNLTSSDASATSAVRQRPSGALPATPTGEEAGQPSGPATPSSTGQPSKSVGATCCNLADGDRTFPSKAPAVDGWEVSRRVVVPRSSTYGPATTDPDGFRRCFAHSPTGAVYAAYNAIAAVADQRQAIRTARKLMLPGSDTDALIRELSREEPSAESAATQLAGYRFLDASRDRATLMLAIPVESAYMSVTLTLVWHDDDWRLQPPSPGEPVGAPFSQHRDLSGFVPWSGV